MNSQNLPQEKISVCLFSDANFLAINVLENLIIKNCFVTIVTNDIGGWSKKTEHISNKLNFVFIQQKQLLSSDHDYFIFVSGFINKNNILSDLKNFGIIQQNQNSKSLLLLPFESLDKEVNFDISVSDNTGIVYIGDLLGPRFDFESNLLIANTLNEILQKRTIEIPVGEVFFPLFAPDVARTITKWLFSFGPYGKEIFLLGEHESGSEFFDYNRRLIPDLKINYNPKIKPRLTPRMYEIKTLPCDTLFVLSETYKWVSLYTARTEKQSVSAKSIKNKKTTLKYPGFVKPLILSAVVFFAFPFLTFAISASLLLIPYKDLYKSDKNDSTILAAKTFFVLGKKQSQFLSYFPGLELVYKEAEYANLLGERFSDIAITVNPTINIIGSLFENTLGDSIYSPRNDTEKLAVNLDYLYQKVAVVQTETQDFAKGNVWFSSFVLTRVDFDHLKNLLFQGISLADSLPNILGEEGRKTYLLLFQNNMELRPTGGFIEAFGILTFDGGRLTDVVINDVYTADEQLNGHVEPPLPIKTHLGEENWFLRDSNWDPDFPTSAKRAEWFLDKEIGKQVDGVLATDLSLIKDALELTGPIFLADHNLNIGHDNLYSITQNEVRREFSPRPTEKKLFLTDLFQNLLIKVESLSMENKARLAQKLFKSLEQRSFQVYLHNEEIRNSISVLNWDGSIPNPSCGENCFLDSLAFVEANFSKNKSNYFITRSSILEIEASEENITHRLKTTFKNDANPALGESGNYKNYMRILIPKDADSIIVKSSLGQNTQSLPSEIYDSKGKKEVAVLFEVLAGQSKEIEFIWQNKVPNKTLQYGLYIRKQAGVENMPITISLTTNKSRIKSYPKFTLTREGAYLYNTDLVNDLFAYFNWQ